MFHRRRISWIFCRLINSKFSEMVKAKSKCAANLFKTADGASSCEIWQFSRIKVSLFFHPLHLWEKQTQKCQRIKLVEINYCYQSYLTDFYPKFTENGYCIKFIYGWEHFSTSANVLYPFHCAWNFRLMSHWIFDTHYLGRVSISSYRPLSLYACHPANKRIFPIKIMHQAAADPARRSISLIYLFKNVSALFQ